jgi:hypothetical protein
VRRGCVGSGGRWRAAAMRARSSMEADLTTEDTEDTEA